MVAEAVERRGSVRRVAQRQTLLGLVTVPEKGRGKNDSEIPGLSNQRSPRSKIQAFDGRMDHAPRFSVWILQQAASHLDSLGCPCTGVLRALPGCTGETCIYADICK